MLLKKLIKFSLKKYNKLNIRGLAANSKEVKKGFIFFAIKGNKTNGEKFINKAIDNGAAVIICSNNCKFKSSRTFIIKTKNIRNFLSEVTSKFYRLKPKNIIAVTGTNGKTSVADFFYQILSINNIPASYIGTLGIKYNKKIIKTNLTTPDTITLHKSLEKLKKNNINNVIIEASSHGLDQDRLNHLNFRAGIFTNFSQDHLDYHKTMKDYLNAKLTLFSKLLPYKSYIISDKFIKEFSTLKNISRKRELRLLDITKKINQIKNVSDSIVGTFQKKNLAMAILAAQLCGLKSTKIKNTLKKIENIEGRLELIKKFPNNIRVFIDYAHTPDALSKVIKSLVETYGNKISLVFGCGGERDFKKRPLMAKIAKIYCKKIYVTDDNPRKENPTKIRKEITNNLKGCVHFNIGNRSQAIRKAIFNAEPNEIILIAGKGHENYQDYGNRIISISDKKIVKNLKANKTEISKKKINYLFNSKILNQIIKKRKFHEFNNFITDSRKVKKNSLFLAIKGKKNDGNKFVSEAIKRGANLVVSSKINKKYKNKIFKVNNEIAFLNKFASLKREKCNAKIIAITGSAGKTSLKNILKDLLQIFGNTYASPRSFNNHLGVPISLSNLSINHEYGVFEVGMSKSGEINKLCKIIKPNLGIITNIGEAHIENFKNIKAIAKAKSEIIKNIEINGTVILNHDDKFFNYLNHKAKRQEIKVITFGKTKKADVHPIEIKQFGETKKITVKICDEIVKLQIKNINIYNILCSLAVLKKFGLNPNKVINVYKNFEPSDGRGKIHKIQRYNKNFKLIDESYNANPLSVKNAINNFSLIKKKKSKKYLLLGDMLELGKKSDIYHKNLSRLINNSDIDKVFIKGEKMIFTYKNLKKEKQGNIFQCDQDIDLIFKNIITNNDYLMIKGSNATGLNNISNSMIKGSNATGLNNISNSMIKGS
jgi:murE/murF fusion protein